ncbi:MAG: IS1634 family transposase, partial [Kosmotoga sp.]
SSKRAKKDMADLNRFVEKATKLLNNKGQITSSQKRGGRKYLKVTKKAPVKWSMDTKAIERDKSFAGYYGIQTSEKNMSPKNILNAYHSLWKIEESFRIMKSTLEVEPVFVWTEQRIKGHFMMCFIAFLLERTLEFQLRKYGHTASPRKIREALNALNFAEIEIEDEPYYVKTKAPSLSNKILRSLRIASPKNVVREIP